MLTVCTWARRVCVTHPRLSRSPTLQVAEKYNNSQADLTNLLITTRSDYVPPGIDHEVYQCVADGAWRTVHVCGSDVQARQHMPPLPLLVLHYPHGHGSPVA